jgi:glycosyltransferase involved in cell wall biosynthesis/ribosomal protein S18 acetylase RimI-like enzyme
MNPVKLLHITGDSCFGGAGRIILQLGQVVRAEGWQVDVLTTNSTFQRAAAEQGLGVVDLDVIRREIRPLWDLAGLSRLARFLRREPYDIVHTHTSKAGFVGRLAARLANVPVIVHTAHGFAFHEKSPQRVRRFYSTLEQAASHWCDRIVSVSEFHRDWALQLGICTPLKIVAIPNGIARLPEPGVAPPELRRRLGARPSDLLILTMARLAADKGLEYLIEAAGMLARYERRFRIVIAGEGPARAALEQQARILDVSEHVIFLGFREDIRDLLDASDLVVLPSLREGLSIALLEAMAAAKPIIATSIGSHKEVAAQGSTAWLVPPADAIGLGNAILRVTRDPVLMARLGTRAKAQFERHYTEERMLTAYKRLYFELLRERLEAQASPAGPPIARSLPEFHAPGRMQPAPVANGCQAAPVSFVDRDDRDHANVRQATPLDLLGIVGIHQEAFSNFFLTRLGEQFLTRYYALVLHYRKGIALVSERHGKLQGFACGFVNPAEFYRLMWANRREFALPALKALIRRPALVTGILYGVHRIQVSASGESARSCELSSIAVAPEAGGNGLGKTLIRAFIAHAKSMDADYVYLTTDADGNDQANALYRQAGFRHTQRFLRRKGRWMNEYILSHLENETAGSPND